MAHLINIEDTGKADVFPEVNGAPGQLQPFLASTPLVITNEQAGSSWTQFYTLRTRYRFSAGIVQQGGALDTDPAALFKTHGQVMERVVEWRVQRRHRMPVLPHFAPSNANEVLAFFEIAPEKPRPTTDGTSFEYTVEGTYTYKLYRPLTMAEGYALPKLPFVTTAQLAIVLRENNFSRALARSMPKTGTGTVRITYAGG